jgi:putative AdoMet-dependent methyltransferase
MKDWIYDESNHVGVDYSQKDNATIYDDQMESFRDYENEAKIFVEKLGASEPQNLTAIDIGCGTGAFSIHASKYLKKIYAVDVSAEMLKIAKANARIKRIDNIEFCKSGFLQFQPHIKADVVFSKWAFHHLPDYWKQRHC